MSEVENPIPATEADTAGRCGRFATYAAIIAVSTGISAARILVAPPLQSANDRSRWCTVWSIVEEGTYAIDTIIRQPGWDTIDKVRFHDRFYSSKPALWPTIVAGVYWGVQQATGWDLTRNTAAVTRLVLLVVNLLPMTAALIVLAALLERYARRDLTRYFVLLTAAAGTFLTTFLVTLNNHTIAAASLMIAVYASLRITADGSRRPAYFALAGFFAAYTCTAELPAALFGLAMFGLLLRYSPAATWKFFVPAALVPIAAFFATTYIASGDWRPFYVWFGKEPYNYTFEGVPSYWSNPTGLDANREAWYAYLLHCTFGHHGIFSLSPVFLLSLAGWCGLRKWRGHPLGPFLWMGMLLTAAILLFYLSRTNNYNYGGNTSGLRWTFWLIPLWLLAMIPPLDCWADCRGTQCAAVVLLSVSVCSAFYPQSNPWQHPWLFRLMTRWGWIDYTQQPADFRTPLMTWFPALPDAETGGEDYWIEFTGVDVDGSVVQFRLSDAGIEPDSESPVPPGRDARRISVLRDAGTGDESETNYVIDVAAFAAGSPPGEFLRWSRDRGSTAEESRVVSFLHGLPGLRPGGYRRGNVRYLKTELRRDAFRCRQAAGQVYHQPPGEGRPLLYRTELWLCPEVPFGVLQMEQAVIDPRSGTRLARRRWRAMSVGKLLDRSEERPSK